MERVFRKPKLLLALTSLEAGEFERLLGLFEAQSAQERAQRTWAGGERRRAPGAGNAGALPTARAKLFFILFYCKAYPLQEVMGWLFGCSQPQVSVWVKQLLPRLNAALGRGRLLPARRPADWDRLLEEVPELLLVIDGTERPVRRPGDPARQRSHYSGKKRGHRAKNLLATAERKVLHLGPNAPGRVHDKRLADEGGPAFPLGTLLIKDTGFQGYGPPGIQTLQPRKKPRGGELHPIQKQINQVISRARITVEHAIAGVKRCRIVADTLRHWRAGVADAVMEAACGLHNLHVACRQAA